MIAPRRVGPATGRRPGGDVAPIDLGADPDRRCGACGTRLSRYNPNERCWCCHGHPIPVNAHIDFSLEPDARGARRQRLLARLGVAQ